MVQRGTLRSAVVQLLKLGLPLAVLCWTASAPVVRGQSDDPLQRVQLEYEGAFRVPAGGTGTNATFEYGGTALTFDSARRSLWMVGHDHYQRVAEVSIPDIRRGEELDDLDTAQLLTPFRDILQGRLTQIGASDAKIGGLIRDGSDWIVSAWIYYDASNSQSRSHFRVSANGTVTGPLQIGSDDSETGFVSGYMTGIPAEWQSRLGGTALAGQCCIPIISRTSLGPAASVFRPADVARRAPVPIEQVLAYPIQHPTLGEWEDDAGGLFNGNTQMGGVVFPDGTDSVLYFGRVGLGDFCYGTGTPNRALEDELVPGGGGARYCYDPAGFDQGTHGYPYALHLWAYDANELLAVRNGQQAPWDVRPYAAGVIALPFEHGLKFVGGAAYDATTSRIFVSVLLQDSQRPLVHVLRLSDSPVPPSTPVPPPVDIPDPPPGGGTGRQRPTDSPPVGRAIPR